MKGRRKVCRKASRMVVLLSGLRMSGFFLAALIAICAGFISTGNAAISFSSSVQYPASGNYGEPFAITSGDFNNDGYPDIAFVDNKDNYLYVLLNNGDGTFNSTPSARIKVDKKPQGIACGDLNNDGKLDIVVSRYDADNVRVYLGNGDGTFTYKNEFATENQPVGVVLAHLNSDNYLDLIVCNYGNKSFSVLTGKGDGTFNTKVKYSTNNDNPWAAAVGDFDGDEDMDVVVTHVGKDKIASVFKNNGSGDFGSQLDVAVGNKPNGVVTGDFDGDEDIDFATGDHDGKSVTVCKNNGTGTSFTPTTYTDSSLEHVRGIVAADFDGDEDLDLAVTNDHDNKVIILENNGSGSFSFVGTGFPVGSEYPRGITAADFDKNDMPDLATANTDGHNISVLINSGTPPAPTTYSISGTVSLIGGGNVQDVLLTLSGASSQTTNPDASGFYSFTGLASGNYTVTPSLADYEFTPDSRNYNPLSSDQTYQDFLGVRQCKLTINSDYDTPVPDAGDHIYDYDDVVSCSVDPEVVDGTTKYICTGYTLDGNTVNGQTSVDVTMDGDHVLTWNWKTQYYLTVNSVRGNPQGEDWYDAGTTANWSVTSPVVDGGTRYVADQASGSVKMDEPKTADVNWSTQYYLTVNSVRGNPQGEDWYDAGTTANWSVTSPVVDGGTRYVADQASGSVKMDEPKTADVNWSTQYYLTTVADPIAGGSVSPTSGWFDAGSNVQIQAFPNQGWKFSNWSGDASGSQNPASITMNGPKTARAVFAPLTQYTISGKVYRANGTVFPGVTVEYTGVWNGTSVSGSTTTATDGSYSLLLPGGWTGTVAPKNSSSMFTPANRYYASLSSNQTNQNYNALGGYAISGYVKTSTGQPISSVILNFGGYGTAITNSTGYYTKTVTAGWSGTVTPYRSGYKFTPASRTYSNVLKNYANQNYTGSR
ncbi:MAG TPA: FG-GAP-like repeat-containing protein [bacterium]|nr:FG-GAP-like repeat-containing protein [bacterium]